MKLARSKNTIRNMRAGLVEKIVTMLGPFIVRTVFIHTLGTEYLGLNSLFTSILSVLSLTELGFGAAVNFSMYRAIAEDDNETINALLHFYRKVYRYIGCIILFVGLLLIPFLPHLVKGSWPTDINLVHIYLIFLLNSTLSYFMFAYLGDVISAFKRADLNSLVHVLIGIFIYSSQIYILLNVNNYYIYLVVMPVSTILSNLSTAIIAKKLFPQYRPFGKLRKEQKAMIAEKVGGAAIQNVCAVSRNTFDSIFISAFLGLTGTAIYSNYYYVMNTVIAFMSIITLSMFAGVGNSVATETQEKNHQDMFRVNFLYMWIAGWCAICLLCLYQQFMEIWAGKELLLPMSSVILICAYFYVLKMGDLRGLYSDANGLWWQNKYRALGEAIANVVLNYLLGKRFGINGIIAATLISLFFINFCYGSRLLYKYYYVDFKVRIYFTFHIRCALATSIVGFITYQICNNMPNTIIFFFARMGVCAIVPNLLYFLIYHKTSIYKDSITWAMSKLKLRKV